VALFMKKPHPAVRPHARAPDHAGLGRNRLHPAGRDLEAHQPVTPLDEVLEQESRRVRPPVLDVDVADELEPEVAALAADEIPDRRPRLAFALLLERQPLVAPHGRPGLRSQRQPLVELLADGRARTRIDHP
jgi:hypothetical protein